MLVRHEPDFRGWRVVSGLVSLLEVLLVVVVIIAVVGGGGFLFFTALAGGSDKPNAGQQTTNVHVNVQVAAPPAAPPVVMPSTDYQAAIHAQAAQLAALHARAAAAELYGPPTHAQSLASAAPYGQIPYGHAAPALDQASLDRAVDAALTRRAQVPELER
jgi:hypothetical protein